MENDYLAVKESPAVCNNMKGPWVCCAKRSKPDKERQALHGITYMWDLKEEERKK